MSIVLKNIRSVIIAEKNLTLLGTLYSYDDYKQFYDETFAPLEISDELRLDEPTSIEFRDPEDLPETDEEGEDTYYEEDEDTESGIVF